jgi:hypothetical protein
MQKDFRPSIWGGFEATEMYPFNVKRALLMLQKEDREVTSQVQQQVFNRLYEM